MSGVGQPIITKAMMVERLARKRASIGLPPSSPGSGSDSDMETEDETESEDESSQSDPVDQELINKKLKWLEQSSTPAQAPTTSSSPYQFSMGTSTPTKRVNKTHKKTIPVINKKQIFDIDPFESVGPDLYPSSVDYTLFDSYLSIDNAFSDSLFGSSNTFGFSSNPVSPSSQTSDDWNDWIPPDWLATEIGVKNTVTAPPDWVGKQTGLQSSGPVPPVSSTLCYVPTMLRSQPPSAPSPYTGPTSWAQTTGSIMDAIMNDTDSICSVLRSDPNSSIFFEPPIITPSTSSSYTSTSSPSKLKYSIHIFEGSIYPFKGYGSFLKRQFEQLLPHSVGGRDCMEVHHTLLNDRATSNPDYTANIVLVERDQFGTDPNPQVSPQTDLELRKFKSDTETALGTTSSNRIYSSVNPTYITGSLKREFTSNLTVMIKTNDEANTPFIASLIILNNGDSSQKRKDNNTQYIDVIANNPRASSIPFLRSTAMALLFTTIRDTTILSSYIPSMPTLSPEQQIKNYIYEFLKFCNTEKKKPDSITQIAPGPIEYISTFKKLKLSAISWQVAKIYQNLGFEVTGVGSYINMELKTDKMLSTISNVNRYGFIFNLLQELALDKLNTTDISDTLLKMIQRRNVAITALSGKPVDSASTVAIRGGKSKTHRRKTHKRKSHRRKTHRRRNHRRKTHRRKTHRRRT